MRVSDTFHVIVFVICHQLKILAELSQLVRSAEVLLLSDGNNELQPR